MGEKRDAANPMVTLISGREVGPFAEMRLLGRITHLGRLNSCSKKLVLLLNAAKSRPCAQVGSQGP